MDARASQEVGIRHVPDAVWERYRRRWGLDGTAAIVFQTFLDLIIRTMLAREYITTSSLNTAVTDFDNKMLSLVLDDACARVGDVEHRPSDANIVWSTPAQRGLYRMCFVEISTEIINGPRDLNWNDGLGGKQHAIMADHILWRKWSPFGLPSLDVVTIRPKTVHERLERLYDLRSSVKNFPFPIRS